MISIVRLSQAAKEDCFGCHQVDWPLFSITVGKPGYIITFPQCEECMKELYAATAAFVKLMPRPRKPWRKP